MSGDDVPCRRQRERFFSLALDMLCIASFDGYFVDLNPRWEQVLGWSREELTSRPFIDFVHPDDVARTVVQADQLAAGSTTIRFNNRYRCRDSSYRWLSWTAISDVDERRIFAVARDISDEKRSEQQLRVIIEGALDAIITMDEEGAITSWSPLAEQLFGWPSIDAVGRNLASLIIPRRFRSAYSRSFARYRAAALGPAPGRVLQLHGLRQNGEEFPIELGVSPVHTDTGATAFVAFVRDIGEHKRLEEELRRARREAEAASEAKSEFLSRMSHELRTPLSAVLGFAELLEMEQLGDRPREYSDAIAKAGNHLLDLINDVLEIARIETGKLALSIEPVPVAELLYDALDLVRPLALPRHITLRTEMRAGADAVVRADRQRLKQVLVNLIANGIKYNREAGDVAVIVTETSTGRTRLEVTDTGMGIAAEDLGKLFTPFERLNAGLTGVEGTGLGLALSKSLTEAMGGNLGVESIVGAGSTFWVELASADAPLSRLPSPEHEQVAGTATYSRAHIVLYVEDTASNVQLISRTLSLRPAVTLVTATHGGRTLELARFHRPGLVLLDMHLPDMDGEQVLEQLKADRETRDIPVVAISADAARARINRVMQRGAFDYLTKPVNVKQLLETVDRLLGEPAPSGHPR